MAVIKQNLMRRGKRMKKIAVVLAVVVLVVSLVSLAFAAGMQKGTIKSVDAKAGTVVFCAEGGKDVTLKADKAVDLGKLKAGDKVEASVEKDTLTHVMAAPAAAPAAKQKAPVGC
jgi:Cu/Ag efflux protein CusF